MEEKKKKKKLTLSVSSQKTHNFSNYGSRRGIAPRKINRICWIKKMLKRPFSLLHDSQKNHPKHYC